VTSSAHIVSPGRGTVLITGAAKRLGRALALDFAAQGWAVGVHYNGSAADAETVVATIARAGGRAVALQADLASAVAASELLPACAAALGQVSALINNASMFVYDTVQTLDAGQWDAHQAVNLRAAVILARALAAQLPVGVEGHIINIIDQRVWKPTPHFFSYAASKAGLWSVTQTMAQALAPRIRVNAIGPGPMLQSVHQASEDFAAQVATVPLQRGTSPDEVAAAIRYILGAPAMTGQMIALDGGQHLAWETPDIGDGRG
jgi:NAD(P)-dependent dehydrogenase (short-subunit alcohol dehydrogenase family)